MHFEFVQKSPNAEIEKNKTRWKERKEEPFFGLCDDSMQKFNINKVFGCCSRFINFKTNGTKRVRLHQYMLLWHCCTIQYTYIYPSIAKIQSARHDRQWIWWIRNSIELHAIGTKSRRRWFAQWNLKKTNNTAIAHSSKMTKTFFVEMLDCVGRNPILTQLLIDLNELIRATVPLIWSLQQIESVIAMFCFHVPLFLDAIVSY